MKNETRQKKYEELLDTVLKLKNELSVCYNVLKTSFNPIGNISLFEKKGAILKEITEKIKESGIFLSKQDGEVSDGNDECFRAEEIKEIIKAEIYELSKINEAFSSLVRKNIYYNQLTISFITDAFKRNSIYDRSGSNNASFSPLKNVLMKSGVRI
ncbi:MAG: hypothetical protein ACP5NA_05270 [Candidatus Acidulodesulfobacterium sp.]